MDLWNIALNYVIIPVFCFCALSTLIIYLVSVFFANRNPSSKVSAGFIRFSKAVLKVFSVSDKLMSMKVILIGGAIIEAIALIGAIISGRMFSDINIFVLTIFGMVLIAAAWVASLFMIKLAMKGLSVALGKAMENFGDREAYVDAVRDVGGKFLVYEDEDPSQYPEDMVTVLKGTRAEAEERDRPRRAYQEAKHRYENAAAKYREYVIKGDRNSAMLYKQKMDIALVDMQNSGWSE